MRKGIVPSAPVITDNTNQCLKRLGLNQNPFSMAPDVVNFYSPTRIETIIVEVLQLIDTRMGFALLYGDVGLGKTTLCRRILFELDRREDVQSALVFNTFYQEADLLREINRDFGISEPDTSLQGQMTALNAFLLEQRSQGNNCVIIIDDAQSLSVESLELVRQISNMETGIDKIVQIILIGQPELEEKLNLHELRQLRSRITLTREFRPFTLQETAAYIRTKVARSGDRVRLEVTDGAVRGVQAASGGIPRRINVIMGRCLYGAVAANTHVVTRDIVQEAIKDIEESVDDPAKRRRSGRRFIAVLATGLAVCVPLALLALGYLEGVLPVPGRDAVQTAEVVSDPPAPVQGAAVASDSASPAQTANVVSGAGRDSGSSDIAGTLPSPARASRHPVAAAAPAAVEEAGGTPQIGAQRVAQSLHLGEEAKTPIRQVASISTAAGDPNPSSPPAVYASTGLEIANAPEVERQFERTASSAGEHTPNAGDDVNIHSAISGFLNAYGLAAFGEQFEAALRTGRLDSVADDIQQATGLRLVVLPAVVADVKNQFVTLQVPDRANDATNYLLFWKPQEWSEANFAVYYDTEAVKSLQTALSRFGAYQFFIDGLAGHRTTAALKLFQRAVGLAQTGVPDVETLFMLEFLNPERRASVTQSGTGLDNNWRLVKHGGKQ